MLLQRKTNKIRKRQSAWLYSAVFTGGFSWLIVCVLMLSFLIQPFHKALASEPVQEVVVEEEVVAQDVLLQEESPPTVETNESPPESESQSVLFENPASETGDFVVSEINDIGEEIQTEINDTEVVEEEESEPDVEDINTDVIDEFASTAEPVEESVVDVQYVVTEENFYQFSKQSCVEVGDGAYQCTSKTSDEADTNSVVYSDIGESGNMEIFLKTSRGKVKQITENSFDDTAPHYDPESMRVVWHRLIDGRYQIILFDIKNNEEQQLTFSKTNNMEPKVSSAGIVWQAWDNNDWEIMLFDGSYTEQLTENDSQDVAPVMQDEYVLWNILGSENQEARVYSLDTKETISIEGFDGGSISNPRFVLVYDTKFENGDIITQSFDPATGLSESIAATPAPAPIDIPETDPTGEIRALLMQGKNQKDEKDVEDVTPEIGSGGGNASSTEPGTLDLTQPLDTVSVAPAPSVGAPFELTEYDLVIT